MGHPDFEGEATQRPRTLFSQIELNLFCRCVDFCDAEAANLSGGDGFWFLRA